MSERVLVSVVVPTYHRADLLSRCLEALRAQELDPTSFEIVVADDAAEEAIRQLVERIAESAKEGSALRYVPVQGRHGPAAARNQGWRTARGAVIAFTDDDCVPAPGWLAAGVAALTEEERAYGRIVVPLPGAPTDYERDAAGLERGEGVTANCFYRREALEAVGGFDERFTAAWREDSDLFFTMLERGRRIVPAPDAVVVHPVRPAPWGVSLLQQRKSAFDALLYRKHPALYRQRIQGPQWRYYRIAGAFLVAIMASTLRRRRLALGASGVWALLTASFCAGRLRGSSRAPGHLAEVAVTSALIPFLSLFWRLRGAMRYRVRFL